MKRLAAGCVRVFLYTIAILSVVLVVLAGVLWYWPPKLQDYRPEVEHLLSDYLGRQIAITTLSAEWSGWNLTLKAQGVRVAVNDQKVPGMSFGKILVSFNPINLMRGGRTLNRLELMGPTIEAERLSDGRIRVGDTILGKPRGTVRHLLEGRTLEITDGTLVWRDALSPGPPLRIRNVHLLVRPSGARRRFEFTAAPPEDLLQRFAGYGIYDPHSLDSGAWTANINISVGRLDLSRIPAVIQERLPWKSRGSVDTRFHAKWVRGVLTAASADVTARDFFIPYSKDKTPLAATRFSSTVSWKRSDREWRLVFTHPEIVLDKNPVSVSRFELERQKNRRIYSARDVNVQDLLGVVDRMDIELPWERLIDRLHPQGVFSRAALTLTGPYLAATGWSFSGDFRDVGWSAQEAYPGVQGVGGHLDADGKGGKLSLSSSNLQVDAAHALRGPVHFERAGGNIEWYRWGKDWVISIGDGVIGNRDLDLSDINVYTRVPAKRQTSPFVLARFRIERADIAALRGYLPVKKMTEKQVSWLDRALAGGEITQGRFYLNGYLDEFPFDQGTGELRITADIGNAELNFNEKWPNLKQLQGVADIVDSHFEMKLSHGVFMNSTIRNARIWSDDFFRRDRLLRIQGGVTAQANDVVQFLRHGPLVKHPPPKYSRMSARGQGDLDLSIQLPFTRLKQDSRVQGDYTVRNVTLSVADDVEFTKLSGKLQFTDRTVQGKDLKAELFGGPVQADVSTVKAGRPMTFAVTGSGESDVSRLTPLVGPVLVSELDGRAQWHGRFVAGPGPNRLDVQSDLKGAEISFPAPLWKPKDVARHIDVSVEFDDDKRRIALNLKDRLRGELRYARQGGRPVLTRGVLNLGGDHALPDKDLAVDVKGDGLDVDQWLSEIEDLSKLKDQAATADPGRDALFDHLRTLDVDVRRFRYLHRSLGAVRVAATSPDGKAWLAHFSGPRIKGTGRMTLGRKPAHYDFDMTRLYWPRLQNTESATTYTPSPKPPEFAYLTIRADDFHYGDMKLGKLDMDGGPDEYAWRIHRLTLHQDALTVSASGSWSADRLGGQATEVQVSAEAPDFGKALEQLGLEGQVAKGTASLRADLSWAGEPGDFRLAALDGDLSCRARDGRFLKLEPGSGRLLGLFNMDTLLRRFRLDFSDVFKEGFTFDHIDGKATITGGLLHTDGIYILGPAALVELRGSTDLGKETYNLGVTVAPQLGGNLSLAGAIANPAAGAMIFVMQKLFRKQMSKFIQYKYRVTGGWDDPHVAAVQRPAPDSNKHIGRN
ncbi:MAG: YhdP family protein [Arenicellales bacterium]